MPTNGFVKPPSLEEMKSQPRPIANVNAVHRSQASRLELLALFITEQVGTMGFFLIIVGWTASWLGWSMLAPKRLQFDPPMAFVLWFFISSMIQILLMPLIMVGQNLQGRHSELRAMVRKLGIDLDQLAGEANTDHAGGGRAS